ncbi:hypothetical protein ACL02R_10435 [Streptomyces sp. MS19]|uniref:hypothetical protein n=1 Tax=Streptomyces sp. MS19 TaxID=3385972 RepID=UPI0039A1C0DC
MTAISTSRGRRAIRTTVAVGAVSLGFVVLAACQKPTPSAHFTLNTHTDSFEADHDCYHGDGIDADRADDCVTPDDSPEFATRSGDTFRIGVDPEVADDGWVLLLNGMPHQQQDPYTSTYQTFDTDELFAEARQWEQYGVAMPEDGSLDLTVGQLQDDSDGDLGQAATAEELQANALGLLQGTWSVRLAPEDHED